MYRKTIQMTRFSSILVVCLVFLSVSSAQAQYGSFGKDTCPADSIAVDDIIYYGEMLDMSNGYQVGDTVFDFTVYDFDGNPLNLYTELSGQKPVVLINGSVSCLRFRGTFEPDNNGQQYAAARNYLESHADDINWIFIYGVEAHPTDGNCPSNCPPTVSNDTTVVQPPFYVNRRYAVHGWEESPEHDFPFTMYADNQDNAVYNNFFQRPFGMVAINCDGTVALRGDWVNSFFMDSGSVAELNIWRTDSNTCTIDWTPEDNSDDDESNGTNDGTNDGGNGADDDTDEDDGNGTGDDDDDTDQGDGDGTDENEDDNGTDDDDTDDDTDQGDGDGTDENEDDNGTDENEDGNGTDDDDTDQGDTDEDETDDDTPTYDGPSEAIGSGTGQEGSASNIFNEKPLELLVYPNPAKSYVQIEGLNDEAQLHLIDISGRIVLDVQTTQKDLKLDVSVFQPGQYILLVQQKNALPQRSSLIIQ
jgi:hypothetical protein